MGNASSAQTFAQFSTGTAPSNLLAFREATYFALSLEQPQLLSYLHCHSPTEQSRIIDEIGGPIAGQLLNTPARDIKWEDVPKFYAAMAGLYCHSVQSATDEEWEGREGGEGSAKMDLGDGGSWGEFSMRNARIQDIMELCLDMTTRTWDAIRREEERER